MKSFTRIFLNIPIVVIVFISFCTCKKEKDPEKTNYIEAKINGALWTPSSVQCVLLQDDTYHFRIVNFTATYGGKVITIEASDNSTGTSINTGTRSFEAGSAYFIYSTSGTPYKTTSGSINISDNDPSAQTVSGSFSFTAEDDGSLITVADGKFEKVKYTRKVQ